MAIKLGCQNFSYNSMVFHFQRYKESAFESTKFPNLNSLYTRTILRYFKKTPIWTLLICLQLTISYKNVLNSVNLRIQSEYRKMWTRKNFIFGQFSCSASCYSILTKFGKMAICETVIIQ